MRIIALLDRKIRKRHQHCLRDSISQINFKVSSCTCCGLFGTTKHRDTLNLNTLSIVLDESKRTLPRNDNGIISSVNDLKVTIREIPEQFGRSEIRIHPPTAAAGGESHRPCEAGAQHQKELLFHKIKVDVCRTQLADIVAE